MTRFKASLTAACVAFLATLCQAHMIMHSPVPYGKDTLNNSPLSGSDFPCKARAGAYTVSEMNTMAAGSPQKLSFQGTAVHGGGSCQISLSKDKEPTAQSKFKVIHSIIGGCPGVNGGPSTFDYQIPAGFPNGEYTLAWTWFNKIGNREMYMNCAPVTVTGGGDDGAMFDALPDIFVANIPSTQCKTSEGKDVVFPNPGDSVATIASDALETALPAACGASSGGEPVGGAPPASSAGPAPSSSTAGSTSKASPSAGSTSTGAVNPPNVSGTSTATVTTLVTVTAGLAPSPSQSVTGDSLSAGTTAATALPAPSSGSGATKSSCDGDGAIVCNGPSQFGICNHGKVTWQAVAPGTTCEGGQILKRSIPYFGNGRGPRSFRA